MIGIIGAMEDEVVLLRQSLEDCRTESPGGGFEFFTGKLRGIPAAVLRSGIGKVNAAVGAALLIQRYGPSLVINTGSAGGIGPGLKVGDAVISTGLVYHDVDLTAFDYAPGQLPGQPAVFSAPPELIEGAGRAIDGLKAEGRLPAALNHVQGIIASGDVFMHEPARIALLRQTFPDVQAVEMEGAAIAHTCALFKVPALIIRALSDVAGTESPVAFGEFLPVASKHSAEIVLRLVRDYGK